MSGSILGNLVDLWVSAWGCLELKLFWVSFGCPLLWAFKGWNPWTGSKLASEVAAGHLKGPKPRSIRLAN